MLSNFDKFKCVGDYGVKMRKRKLQIFCGLKCPVLEIRKTVEGTLDLQIANRVRNIVARNPGYPDQFPYTDSWYKRFKCLSPGLNYIFGVFLNGCW